MRKSVLFLLLLAGVGGCREAVTAVPDGFCDNVDHGGGTQPDLIPAMPSCPAARGLAGDSLICVDFSQVQGLNDPQLMGWDFTKQCPQGWEIVDGQLQIHMFGSFMGTCNLGLPAIDLTQSQYSQYNSITLALRQTVDMDPGTATPNQYGQIYLGAGTPPNLVTQITNTQIEQQMTLTVDKQKLPAGYTNVYHWLLIAGSSQGKNNNGWQISSVALMGNR